MLQPSQTWVLKLEEPSGTSSFRGHFYQAARGNVPMPGTPLGLRNDPARVVPEGGEHGKKLTPQNRTSAKEEEEL